MADPVKPRSRWTEDTSAAFLLALKLHGTVAHALKAIGRHSTAAYDVRKRDAAFAARWDAVLAEMRAEWTAAQASGGGFDPAVPRIGRERRDGWSEAKRKRFLGMLARGETVEAACAAVGLSTHAAHALRKRSPAFAARWQAALAEQALSPIEAAYVRAVEGWEEPIVFQGKVVATKRRYSDAALRLLVQREEKRVARAEAAAALASKREATGYAEPEETDKAILAKLDQIEARRRKIGAEDALAFEARMKREGWAP